MKRRYPGGCLRGALRYEAEGEPVSQGHCYCADCRKASGSGFIPFLEFSRSTVRFAGQRLEYRSPAASGREAVRNSCPLCGGLVFGGDVGAAKAFTLYAGSLDEPSSFRPEVAIFTGGCPAWAVIAPGLRVFEGLPRREGPLG